MSTYFDPTNLTVSDGDDADAININNLVNETDAAFEQVEQDILEVTIGTIFIAESITYTVGSGGDYSTINEALEYVSSIFPLYSQAGIEVTLQLLSGFVMSEQVIVNNIDLSFVTIESVDATVTITRSSLTQSIGLDSYGTMYPAFGAVGGKIPNINTNFSMDSSGTATARAFMFVTGPGGSGIVADSAGCVSVSTTTQYGLICNSGGMIYSSGAVVTGFETNVRVDPGGDFVAYGADFSGAGYNGAYCAGGFMSVRGCDCQNGGSPSSNDIRVSLGGTVLAGSATGGLSQTANTIAATGIIFQ